MGKPILKLKATGTYDQLDEVQKLATYEALQYLRNQ